MRDVSTPLAFWLLTAALAGLFVVPLPRVALVALAALAAVDLVSRRCRLTVSPDGYALVRLRLWVIPVSRVRVPLALEIAQYTTLDSERSFGLTFTRARGAAWRREDDAACELCFGVEGDGDEVLATLAAIRSAAEAARGAV